MSLNKMSSIIIDTNTEMNSNDNYIGASTKYFVIKLVKNSNQSPSEDTTIKITHVSSKCITITTQEDASKTTLNFLSRDHFYNHIDDMLTFLRIDDEPYDNIQFIMPGIPTTLFSKSSYKYKYMKRYFLRCIKNWANALDTESRYVEYMKKQKEK